MDTKKLRQKILDLAIRGKLVPQDPNDEPASVLLERIRAEKERLIKEGKIKRNKKSVSDTPHYENIDFRLPENWQLSTLGEIFYMHAGKNIVASEISPSADETYHYKCIGGNGIRGYVQQFNTEGSYPIIGRQGALCGNINYIEGKFYATEHAVVVDTFCETNVKWAFYFLIQLNLNQYATATAQPGLSVNTIGDVQIPIPPKEEQCRIVSNIEQWFRILDALERGKDELEESIIMAKSKILDLAIHGKLVPHSPEDEPAIELLKRINPKFTPCDNAHCPYDIPSGWEWSKGSMLFEKMESCKPIGKDFIYIDVDAIDNKQNKIANPKILLTSNAPSRATRKLHTGDVLFSMVRPYLKNIALVTDDYGQAIGSTGFYVLSPIKAIHSSYLFYMVLSSYVIDGLNEFMKGDNSPSINKKNIEEFLYPVPPYNEQQRIVEKIEELFAVLDEIKESLEA